MIERGKFDRHDEVRDLDHGVVDAADDVGRHEADAADRDPEPDDLDELERTGERSDASARATTAMGSVAAIHAAKTRALDQPKPLASPAMLELVTSSAAVAPMAAMTPGTARARIARALRRNSDSSR
jgi:hypothetical protein